MVGVEHHRKIDGGQRGESDAHGVPRAARGILNDHGGVAVNERFDERCGFGADDDDAAVRRRARAGAQHPRHHRHAGDGVKRLRDRGAHAGARTGREDDQSNAPRRSIGLLHGDSCDSYRCRTATRARRGDVVPGWRARIRTWNKGSKDPCDTISLPANTWKRCGRWHGAGTAEIATAASIPARSATPARPGVGRAAPVLGVRAGNPPPRNEHEN